MTNPKIHIPIGGIDTKMDPRLVSPGSLLKAENVVFTETGAATKRDGFQRIDGSEVAPLGDSTTNIIPFGDTLMCINRDAYTYLDQSGEWAVHYSDNELGPLETYEIEQINLGKSTRTDAFNPVVAVDSNYIYAAWFSSDSSGVYPTYTVLSRSTLKAVIPPNTAGSLSGTPTTAECWMDITAYNGKAYLVHATKGSTTAYYALYQIEPTGATVTTLIDSYNHTATAVQVSIDNDGTNLVVYAKLDGTTASAPLHTRTLATPGTVVNSVSPSALSNAPEFVKFLTGGEILCADTDNYQVYNSTLGSSLADGATSTTGLDRIVPIGENSNSEYLVALVKSGNQVSFETFDNSGTVDNNEEGVSVGVGGTRAPSHLVYGIIEANDTVIAGFADDRASTARGCVVSALQGDVTTGNYDIRTIGSHAYGTAAYYPGPSGDGKVGKPAQLAAGEHLVAGIFPIVTDPSPNGLLDPDDLVYAPCLYRLKRADRRKAIGFAGGYVTAPGCPQFWDGKGSLKALGIHEILRCESATDSGGGSANMTNGATYLFALMYEWTDGNGNIHRSAPSPQLSYTASSTNDVTVEYCNAAEDAENYAVHAAISEERTTVYLVGYRTEANGTILYRESAQEVDSFSTDTFTFGGSSDATIAANESLYTTGGKVENMPPPPFKDLARVGNRLFGISSENPNRIYFSQEEQVGLGPEFSLFLTFDAQLGKGPATAIAELDGRVIIFFERAIGYTGGPGPDSRGVGAFPQIVGLPSDVGCVEPLSVVETPNGLMFKSHKGIFLLDRSLNVSYIGRAVEDHNSTDVLKAVSDRDNNAVAFLLSGGSTVLHYDYFHNMWSTWSLAVSMDDVAVVDGVIHMSADSKVYKQDTSSREDGTGTYNITIETPWIKVDGLQGFHRIKSIQLVGQAAASHTARVRVYMDYDSSTIIDTKTYTQVGSTEDWDIHFKPSRQKCKSIKLEITDSSPDANGDSFKLTGIELEYQPKGGRSRFNPAAAAT